MANKYECSERNVFKASGTSWLFACFTAARWLLLSLHCEWPAIREHCILKRENRIAIRLRVITVVNVSQKASERTHTTPDGR